eukprot:TRINITY_DN2223_c0_g1_i1.p1 TRINITY_DN2223_c0_g1~~TRINITY_DN2223_c0_g1_i1.p1  ORF type:complete len:305 (+),score=79.43 TRINITY_DN2223_c0_g1_i1:433-1347(+)
MSRLRKDPSEKLHELLKEREKTLQKLNETFSSTDDISHFQKERMSRDVERERERSALKAKSHYEKRERDRLGASAWFDLQEQRAKDQAKQEKEISADSMAHDVQLRKELRELKRDARQDMNKRQDDFEKMRMRWREEDEKRSRSQYADEKHQREEQWRRDQFRKDQLSREKDEYRREYEQRMRERDVRKRIEDNKYSYSTDKDYSAEFDLDKIRSRKATESERREKAIDSTSYYDKLTPSLTIRDLRLQLPRETTTKKYHNSTMSRYRRLNEIEGQQDDMKSWYAQRDYDRKEQKRRAINNIHS